MHSIQNLNSLIIEDLGKINLPEQVKLLVNKIDWQNQFWFVSGLPLENCKYCFSNDLLYLEEDEDGNCLVKQSDFTGEIFFSTTIINPEPKGDNFLLGFKGLVFKGLLVENELLKFKIQSFEEYEKGFEEYKKEINNSLKILNSKWYKYFYIPYFLFVKWTFAGIVYLLNKLINLIYLIFEKITLSKI